MIVNDRKRDRQELYNQLILAGAKPASKGSFHCFLHKDGSPSSWIKKSEAGYYYWKCAVCSIYHDVWSLEEHNTGKSFKQLVEEHGGSIVQLEKKYVFQTIDEVINSIEDALVIEEINLYTNPDNKNVDLFTIRYIPRGGNKKSFIQGYQSTAGFLRRRPPGLLPLFNRMRVKDAETVIYVEGEACVRKLHELGIVGTTGSGGSNNGTSHDYSFLKGKTVILWRDYDVPGTSYMETVREKCLEQGCKVLEIDVEGLELQEGGDVVDVCDKIIAEGGTIEDCKSCVEALIEDASETNKLESLETLLSDMRSGKYKNLPFSDLPIITNEAVMMLNKRIGVIYGSAGAGKSMIIGKACDDLALSGIKVARLQLEDEIEQHLLRTLAQRAKRGDIANPAFHKDNPVDSEYFYKEYKPDLEIIADTVVSGEHDTWDVDKILKWMESKLDNGHELVVVDPVSVISDKTVWLTSHRLIWNAKKLLAKYPDGRIIFVSHSNTEGEVAGGQALRRFSHSMLQLNRLKEPVEAEIATVDGDAKILKVDAYVEIVKSRYGRGQGLKIAVHLDPNTLTIQELGVILSIKKKEKARPSGRDLNSEVDYDADI